MLRVFFSLLLLSCSALHAEEFFSVAPCRVLDTRQLGGPLPANAQLDFQVRGTPGGSQGGEVGCGIPAWATGVVANLSVVGAAGAGYARLWSFDQSEPFETSILFNAGNTNDNMTVPIAGIFSIADLSFKTTQATHVVVGIMGYTAPGPTTGVSGSVFDILSGGPNFAEVIVDTGDEYARIWCGTGPVPASACYALDFGEIVHVLGSPHIAGGIVIVAHQLVEQVP